MRLGSGRIKAGLPISEELKAPEESHRRYDGNVADKSRGHCCLSIKAAIAKPLGGKEVEGAEMTGRTWYQSCERGKETGTEASEQQELSAQCRADDNEDAQLKQPSGKREDDDRDAHLIG